jgi:ribosomal-protein-alanine N-acetyltransferase
VIRKAVRSDIPKVMEIEKSLFSDPWDERLFLDALDSEGKHFFVSMLDDLAGYVIFEIVLDEGHITNLAVAPGRQRKGIATQLVGKVVDLAKGLKMREIFLEVRQSNEAAKGLYSKFGFREIGRRKAYYPRANEDALVLSLKL